MNELLPDGGTIRKLWIGETDAYRDHLLRLDHESRHRRFSGAVSDEVIARHAATAKGLGVVVYGFFVDGVLRGAAELRQNGSLFSHEAEAAFSIEQPWQSHGVGTGCSNARCSPHATAASSRCTWTASPTISACSSSPASSTPNSRSISAAWSAKSIRRARRRCR